MEFPIGENAGSVTVVMEEDMGSLQPGSSWRPEFETGRSEPPDPPGAQTKEQKNTLKMGGGKTVRKRNGQKYPVSSK